MTLAPSKLFAQRVGWQVISRTRLVILKKIKWTAFEEYETLTCAATIIGEHASYEKCFPLNWLP